MDIFSVFLALAAYIFLFDVLLRFFYKDNSEQSKFFPANLLLWFMLISKNEYSVIQNKKHILYQGLLLISFFFFTLNLTALFLLNIDVSSTNEELILWILPIVTFPFVHILFAILKKNDLVSIYNAIDIFRTRVCVSLAMTINLAFNIIKPNTVLVVHLTFSFIFILGIIYLINLTSYIIKEKSLYSLESNADYSFGPVRFYYYLFSLSEICYYFALFLFIFIWKYNFLIDTILPTLSKNNLLILLSVALLLSTFILLKIFISTSNLITKKFMKSNIIVITFFVIGLSVLLENIFEDLKKFF